MDQTSDETREIFNLIIKAARTKPPNDDKTNNKKRKPDTQEIKFACVASTMRIGQCLGTGAYSQCHELDHPNYVLKILKVSKQPLITNTREVHLEEQAAMQQREIQVHFSLQHPYIVKLYEVRTSPSYLFLLMERCDGGTLDEHVKSKKGLSIERTQRYGLQLIEALNYLHSEVRVLHRDIKASNVLMSKDQLSIRLADFGLCTSPAPKNTRLISNRYCGTLNYMAPEMVQKRGGDDKVDIWSFGVLLFFMLFNRCPFEGQDVSSTFINIVRLNYNVTSVETNLIGPEALDLFKRIFVIDSSKRPTLQEIKKHSFFRKKISSLRLTDQEQTSVSSTS